MTAIPSCPPEPDAELLALCREFHAQDAAVEYAVAAADEPDALRHELRGRGRISDRIESIRPGTEAGRSAKAGIAALLLAENHGASPADADTRFALAVLRDIAAPPPAEPADADADLLAACAAFHAVAGRHAELVANPCQKPYGDPETNAYETAIETVNDEWDEAARAVAAFPAATATGLAAKAAVVDAVVRDFYRDGDALADGLVLGLLADLRTIEKRA